MSKQIYCLAFGVLCNSRDLLLYRTRSVKWFCNYICNVGLQNGIGFVLACLQHSHYPDGFHSHDVSWSAELFKFFCFAMDRSIIASWANHGTLSRGKCRISSTAASQTSVELFLSIGGDHWSIEWVLRMRVGILRLWFAVGYVCCSCCMFQRIVCNNIYTTMRAKT
jgi:hypothetical protein